MIVGVIVGAVMPEMKRVVADVSYCVPKAIDGVGSRYRSIILYGRTAGPGTETVSCKLQNEETSGYISPFGGFEVSKCI